MRLLSSLFGGGSSSSSSSTTNQTDARTLTDASRGGIVGQNRLSTDNRLSLSSVNNTSIVDGASTQAALKALTEVIGGRPAAAAAGSTDSLYLLGAVAVAAVLARR